MARDDGFKPAKIGILIDDPDDAEQFLRGLIVARSNNSSEYFQELIDGVNHVLENWRRGKLEREMEARAAAGMP